MNEFEKWDIEFRSQNLSAFNNNHNGLLWLKVRALCRGKQLKLFVRENNIHLCCTKIADQNIELFEALSKRKDAMAIIDRFLQCLNNEWYNTLGVDIDRLKADLYKIHYYVWGGDQNNSLDRYFVNHYVKIISNFTELQSRQTEIGVNAWNYVQNSWYNNWTSFVIESFFKQNPRVISAVGEIKSVDFFIDNYPLDLKVTFFPNQFMEQKIKLALGKSSLSWLKEKCKVIGITCDKGFSTQQQIYTLMEKLREIERLDIMLPLENTRREIIEESQNNPMELMKWLYENQGEMRFGAENRIYLVLADSKDFTQSWKMKRAFALIEPKVNEYLEAFSTKTLKTVEFEFKKKRYNALSDILYIVR
ncbi:MAG: hypothetical protein J6L73_02935 [Muribaculaceae bacterium]|nr:hypothetical protein [Muribaculaceae bacterium]